jgi:hypothetical protein
MGYFPEDCYHMNTKDELLFAVKAAQHSLPPNANSGVIDILAFLEGMAQFLDKDTILEMKCRNCDNYAPSFFPIDKDFEVVDSHEYCHTKKQPFHHMTLFTIARCLDYSEDSQKEVLKFAEDIVDEELRPALEDRKLYDRHIFASYDVEYNVDTDNDKACIELGHKANGSFEGSGIKLYLLRRLDPGWGGASKEINEGIQYDRQVVVVSASHQMRRWMGLDDVLGSIAKKRKMDIVYL